MKNDSDIYSGHKTLLKISIYQFNKTSSGVTEAEPPRDRYHEALVIIQQSRKQVMICWFYVIIGVILRVVMNEMSVYLVDHTQHHTGDSRHCDPQAYKSTDCSLQIPYQCRSLAFAPPTWQKNPFKLNISSHCVAHGLKWLFCVFFITEGARHHFAKGAKIL